MKNRSVSVEDIHRSATIGSLAEKADLSTSLVPYVISTWAPHISPFGITRIVAETVREARCFEPTAGVRAGTLGVIDIAGTAVAVADDAYRVISPNLMGEKSIEDEQAQHERESR